MGGGGGGGGGSDERAAARHDSADTLGGAAATKLVIIPWRVGSRAARSRRATQYSCGAARPLPARAVTVSEAARPPSPPTADEARDRAWCRLPRKRRCLGNVPKPGITHPHAKPAENYKWAVNFAS